MNNKYRYKLLIKCRNSPQLRELARRLLVEFAGLREFQKVTAYADPQPGPGAIRKDERLWRSVTS
mgnify:CR=1 FL=1